MQGANDQGENRWNRDVIPLMQGNVERDILANDIVALQEVGAVPNGAVATGRQAILGNATAREYTWRVGTARNRAQTLYIYHLMVSNNGNPSPGLRTNLAIVSTLQAPEFHVLRNQDGTTRWAREVLGVRFQPPGGQTTRFYTVHAGSNGPNNSNQADNILAYINIYQDGVHHWVAPGDYNRDLQNAAVHLNPPAGAYRYGVGEPTHTGDGAGELDFAFANTDVPGWIGHLMAAISDHSPVRFGPQDEDDEMEICMDNGNNNSSSSLCFR
ncbi:endonuclease/exonuclease/phosphatase family protein [Maritalea sp.]|uniref:endonuclease/exonuclease/phosphatase family protein n=1 Tax=Maritalea sp. TaxID=2003361 RepID=UPI003EFAC3BC